MRVLSRRERPEAPAQDAEGTTASAPERTTAVARERGPVTAPPAEGGPPAGTERAPSPGASPAEREPARAGRRRRGLGGRTRDAGAATAGALGSAVLTFARLVMAIAVLIALLIGLAIVLVLVDANTSNTIVKGIHEGANFFAGSFTGLITFSGHPKREILVDWGIALIVFLVVGAILSRLIARIGYGGLRFERRHRSVSAN